jgi:hypothetical protein
MWNVSEDASQVACLSPFVRDKCTVALPCAKSNIMFASQVLLCRPWVAPSPASQRTTMALPRLHVVAVS